MPYSITEAFVAWLESMGYRASTYPPADGDEFVTIERTSGGVENLIDYPSIAIQAWAETETRAEEIANDIRYALLTTSRPEGVAHISINAGPYRFYDEDTRLPRYQLVVDCTTHI